MPGLYSWALPKGSSRAGTGGTSVMEVLVGDLVVDGGPTPEQLALFLPLTGTVAATATTTCAYRVQGAESWITGHPLYRIRPSFSLTPGNGGAVEDGFAWTIIDLLPNTTYEVEVTITDGAAQSVRSLTTTTRALPAAAGAATVNVSAGSTAAQIATAINDAPAGAVIVLANGTYNLTGQINITSGGSSGSPKYVRGASRDGVILARSTIGVFFNLDANLSDLVIENLTIQGNGVDAGAGAGAYSTVLGQSSSTMQGSLLATRVTLRNITATGIDRGVYVYRCEQLLVYDNTFTGNNLWQTTPVDFLDSNRTWDDDGALVAGVGNCVFNNFLKGFGDTCSCVQDDGSHGRSLHFYRNDIRNSCDDVLEVDDGRRNITFYDNRIHNSIDFDSLDPLYGGPVLIARNIYINPARSYPHKWNSQNSGHFLYNNTYISTASAVGFDIEVSGWYQTNNGAQRSYGYRNNVHVYRGSGVTLQMDASTNDPIDWTHNSWFPNDGFQMAGQFFANLASIQSGISNRTPIFSGTNRPFENDNITVTNPWTATITLGADALTEVTATYLPILSGGSAPKNSGVVIPNITDGFSGASPDRGAVIEGRDSVFYGDRSIVPEYIADMTDYEVRAMSGSYAPTNGMDTMAEVTTGGWETDYSGVNFPDAAGVIIAWCGGFKAVSGTHKLRVHGGGHFDSANNGIYVFDFDGTTAPTGWSIEGQSGSPSNAVQNGTYTDGKPTSIHSYDGLVYASHNDTLYRFGGYDFGAASNLISQAWKFSNASQTWTQLTSYPGGGLIGSVIYDPVTQKIFVSDGQDNGSSLNAYFFDCSDDTWSSPKAMSHTPGNDAVMAWDSSRGRALVYGSSAAKLLTIDFAAETVSSASASAPALANARSFFYDSYRDVYWAFGGSGSSSWTTLWEINASTLATTASHTLSASIPVVSQHQGSYGRFVFIPEWRVIGTVASNTTAAYLIKLPN